VKGVDSENPESTSSDNWSDFEKLLPTRLAMNGKPMLLIQMGVNETDMVWTSLAVFTGTRMSFLSGTV
jgi:hypothetical protein